MNNDGCGIFYLQECEIYGVLYSCEQCLEFFLNNFLIVVVEIGKDSNFHEKAKSSFIWVPKMNEWMLAFPSPASRKENEHMVSR